MSDRVAVAVISLLLMAAGAVLLRTPSTSRSGLLFGVYVGETASAGEIARRLRLRWKRWMLGTFALTGALLISAIALVSRGLLVIAALALVAGYVTAYVSGHRAAGNHAESAHPEPTASPALRVVTPVLLPYAALAVGLLAGLIAIGYTAAHLSELPERLPLRFGLSGAPEAFAPRSFATVWVLPLLTLLVGVLLGTHSVAVGRTDRRFHTIRSSATSILAILISAAMAQLSLSSVRVGLGREPRLSMSLLLLAGVALVAGLLQLAVRPDQLRGPSEGSPSADGGLADNRRWVLGIFYVNRHDPAWFVENRFGYGYTPNLANWRASALLLGAAALISAFVVVLLDA